MSRRTPVPSGLTQRSVELWKKELRTRSRSSGRLAVLEQCLRALDEADRLRALLDAGEFVTMSKTTGMAHLNPLWKARQESLTTFARLARLLDLQWDPQRDGEPDPPVNRYMQPRWREATMAHDDDDP
jgi:hypothetical protein